MQRTKLSVWKSRLGKMWVKEQSFKHLWALKYCHMNHIKKNCVVHFTNSTLFVFFVFYFK